MDKDEMLKRVIGLQNWLRLNRHNDFYYGVLNYKNRLSTLLYEMK